MDESDWKPPPVPQDEPTPCLNRGRFPVTFIRVLTLTQLEMFSTALSHQVPVTSANMADKPTVLKIMMNLKNMINILILLLIVDVQGNATLLPTITVRVLQVAIGVNRLNDAPIEFTILMTVRRRFPQWLPPLAPYRAGIMRWNQMLKKKSPYRKTLAWIWTCFAVL